MIIKTKYMDSLEESFKQKKNLSQSSINIYLQQLSKLNDSKGFNNLNFLKDVDSIMDKLKDYKDNTKKTYLSSIMSVLNILDKKPKYYDTYNIKLIEMIKNYNTKDKNEPTTKEANNWITQDELDKIKTGLMDKIEEFKDKKTLNSKNWLILTKLFVLSLYTDIEPRRNQDYQFMLVAKNKKNLDDTNYNYIIPTDELFIFNKYKTAKSMGQQQIKYENPEFKRILDLYLKFHPLRRSKTNYYLLVNSDGKPYLSVNSMTRLINKIFKKRIGVSQLRKLYLTNKYGEELDIIKQMRETAYKMGHTSTTAQNVYIKNIKNT